MNKNKGTAYQNLLDAAKALLPGLFIGERSQINLKFHLNDGKKKKSKKNPEQVEERKIRAEINIMENRKQ